MYLKNLIRTYRVRVATIKLERWKSRLVRFLAREEVPCASVSSSFLKSLDAL